ncbi:flagellar hook-length control protein FliK [Marinivivus vitaminiproducens]|uniref:flagellar hook-length control protein FliK n=1 Tax=Marinivivus vitaminiproducens TaxID=3035935 RepID=UPI0027A00B32|nr:flagellar hook-length control protein FliK [Geminicoccaceae bacterium SCSIO 64248]
MTFLSTMADGVTAAGAPAAASSALRQPASGDAPGPGFRDVMRQADGDASRPSDAPIVALPAPGGPVFAGPSPAARVFAAPLSLEDVPPGTDRDAPVAGLLGDERDDPPGETPGPDDAAVLPPDTPAPIAVAIETTRREPKPGTAQDEDRPIPATLDAAAVRPLLQRDTGRGREDASTGLPEGATGSAARTSEPAAAGSASPGETADGGIAAAGVPVERDSGLGNGPQPTQPNESPPAEPGPVARPVAPPEPGQPMPMTPPPVEPAVSPARTAAGAGPLPAHRPDAAPAAEQVAVHIARAIEDDRTTIQVNLEPPELGRVEITLDFGADRLDVTVHSARDEVLAALHKDRGGLARALQEAGLEPQGVTIRFEDRGRRSSSDTSGRPRRTTEDRPAAWPAGAGAWTPSGSALPTWSAGRLDLRV